MKNVVDVSVGGYTRITDGNTIAYSESYCGGLSNHMVINIPPNHDFIAWEYVVYDLTIKP